MEKGIDSTDTTVLHSSLVQWNMQDELSEKKDLQCDSSNGLSFLDHRSTVRPHEKVESEAMTVLSSDAHGPDIDFFKDPKNTASLIRWKDYTSIYPILGAYGGPSYIYPTKYCCVFGTARGPVLIFSAKQILLSRLVPQLATDSSEHDFIRSRVDYLAVSVDGTHIAAAYQSGDVFIWNLNASNSSDQQSMASSSVAEPLRAIIRIKNHQGKVINGMGFVGARHTAVIVSDTSGQILYHNGYRSRLWSLTYNSKSIMDVPSGQLLRSEVAPQIGKQGNPQMVAVLAAASFSIISTTSKPTMLFLESIGLDNTETSLTNSCLSWSKDGTKVSFSLNNTIQLFVLSLSNSNIVQKKFKYSTNEPILSLEWMSDELLGILTVSHQLLLADVTNNFKTVMELDLLMHDLLIPPDKHVAIRANEIYACTQYTLKIGKFATWLDVTLYRVQNGNYIEALNFFETLLQLKSPFGDLIKLERKQAKKEDQLGRPFINLALAALRFIFEESHVEYDNLFQLFSTILRVIRMFENEALRLTYLNSFLEQSLEYFKDDNIEILYEVIVNYVAVGLITALPPYVFKNMLEHYAERKRTAIVQDLIMTLDHDMLDIDLAVKICETHGLFDVLVYIWAEIFGDYITPFVDALYKISQLPEESILFKNIPDDEMEQLYAFLSFTLTGRQYPEGLPIHSHELEMKVKAEFYQIIFSGSCVEWPPNSSKKLHTKRKSSDEPAFPYLNLLLRHNPRRCLSTLNEAFEDPYLNDSEADIDGGARRVPISRQNIMYIMLDIIRREESTNSLETVLLAIFISSNTSKYPQFIRLNNQDHEKMIDILCQVELPGLNADIQRALESVLTVYAPSNSSKLIKQLEEKHFTRVLFNIYTKARRFIDLLLLALGSEDTNRDFGISFLSITQTVLKEVRPDSMAHPLLVEIIDENFTTFLKRLGPNDAAVLFDKFDNQLHQWVVRELSKDMQLEYLNQVFELSSSYKLNQDLKRLYVDLTIQRSRKEDLLAWLRRVDFKNLDTQYILHTLKTDHKHEEAFVVHSRLEMFSSVVEDMICCIEEWFNKHSRQYETLDYFLTAATSAANSSKEDREENWIKLIASFFNLSGSNELSVGDRKACRRALQKVFVTLAVSDCSQNEREMGQLETILTGVLESQNIIMRRAQDMKDLLLDVFTAYNIERHISKLILQIIEYSSTGKVSYYKEHVQNGQSIHDNECIICGKIIWGLGLDTKVFEIWESVNKKLRSHMKFNRGSVILFFCRHSFHRECLENLGQKADAFFCLTCKGENHQIE